MSVLRNWSRDARNPSNSGRQGGDGGDPKSPPPEEPPGWRPWLLVIGAVITLVILWGVTAHPGQPTPRHFTYSQLRAEVAGNHVATAVINPKGKVQGTLRSGKHYISQIPLALQDKSLAPLLTGHHVKVTGTGPQTRTWPILVAFLPLALFAALFLWLGRAGKKAMGDQNSSGGGLGGLLGGMGNSKAKVYDADRPTTRFADVAGYEGPKQEISEVVEFLRSPQRFARAGAVGPHGVLMVGPPGTGKTLLARAVAGEASVPFFALNGSSFVEMFVGVGAKRARDLFAQARRRAPCIVFIDEIDAIGGRRGGSLMANDEREQTLNQLLAEMDGFDPSTGVVILAATNRPDSLDQALLRPGRFDRQATIPLPNRTERAAILAVHATDKRLSADVDLDVAARATPGFSGADLANLVNEAAIAAVRGGREVITAVDLDAARDRVMIGQREESNALLPEEKRAVAVHEAGHAVVAALSMRADPVAKVTILPAGRALGVTEQLPVDEAHLHSESYLTDALNVRLAGRASEILVLGEASTGAANDLSGATDLAGRMVREFGMNHDLGPIGYARDESGSPAAQMGARPYAEATQRAIDEEVARLVTEAEHRATAMLSEHREALDGLVEHLLEEETVDGSAVYATLGLPVRLAPNMRGDQPDVGTVTAPSADTGEAG